MLEKRSASYRAPGPIRPATVRRLRVRRSGSSLVASWKATRGAQQYVVRVDASDGRGLLRLVKGRSVRVRGIGRNETVRVTVAGRNAKGRQGQRAKAQLKKARRKRR